MFECPGLKPGDGGRFRVHERTNLLFVEFNTVSCSSRSTMEAGPWTGKGCSAPWMYHRVAGQYTLFEKQLVSDFAPCPRRPGPRVLHDSTNWHGAQPPPPRGPPRQGKERRRPEASPKAPAPWSPTPDGCSAEPAWGAALPPKAADRGRARLGAAGKSRGEPPARPPPSYEAHMLLRAGQGPRKENWPRPPPYVAPPSYEAPHRTVPPRARRTAGAGDKPVEAAAPPPGPPGAPRAERQSAAGPAKAPGGWSYLLGARTWAGRRRRPEPAEPSPAWAPGWPRSAQPRSYTLPRASKRPPAYCAAAPQHALPAGWGFSRAAGGPEPGGRPREAGGSVPPAGRRAAAQRPGGLLVIDAMCVVIQTYYIPPGRAERVRYLHQPGAKRSPAGPAPAPAPPGPASLEERASRILGLPASELGFSGPASPQRSCPAEAPGRALSPAPGSPATPFPAAANGPAEPPATGPSSPAGGRAAQARGEPSCGAQSSSYARDLRAAMARIRRHTAPDSDTDEELELARARRPAGGRLSGAALSCSSSSSLESSGSNATVVPGGAEAR